MSCAFWHNPSALPQINHGNPDLRAFPFKVVEHWLHKGIYGWRLDALECIQTPGFWEEFRARTKAINLNAYLVGKILPKTAE